MALSKRNSFQTDWTGRPKVGVGVEYQLPSSPFALKSGLYYMQRGYSVDYKSGAYPYQYGYSWRNAHEQSYGGSGQPGYGTVDGGYGNYYDYPYNYGSTLKRHFLQLPVMLDYSFRLADEVQLHLAAGPYIAASLSDH